MQLQDELQMAAEISFFQARKQPSMYRLKYLEVLK